MTSALRSPSEFSRLSTGSGTTPGEFQSASGKGAAVFNFHIPVQTSDAAAAHTEVDAFFAELDANPVHVQGFEEARAWVAEQLYGAESETLKKLRLQKGFTQAQLAELLATSQPHIARLESGTVEMTLSTFKKLCAVLDVDMQRLSNAVDNQNDINFSKAQK